MFDKTIMMNKVISTLQENDFETFVTRGSFDIVAKREHLILIKTLLNIDSLDEHHAMDLRATSYFLSAYPFVISQQTNRDHLDNSIMYSRFELPVVTPQLFKSLLEDDEFTITHSSKGRHTQEINTFLLKEKRKELDLTLEDLGRRVGVSKKAMYEIENKRVNPQDDTVKRLEIILDEALTLPYEMKHTEAVYLKPRHDFQRSISTELSRIGIDNSAVHSTPFEIVGKEDFSLITSLSQSISNEREFMEIRKLSGILSSKAVVISKKPVKENLDVSVILEQELNEIQSSSELSKIIDERSV